MSFRALALCACFGAASSALPAGPLIAAYANACDVGVLRAARAGVNVLYWFASSLAFNETTGEPYVSYAGPPLDCVAAVALTLRAEGLETAHLMTMFVLSRARPRPEPRARKTRTLTLRLRSPPPPPELQQWRLGRAAPDDARVAERRLRRVEGVERGYCAARTGARLRGD